MNGIVAMVQAEFYCRSWGGFGLLLFLAGGSDGLVETVFPFFGLREIKTGIWAGFPKNRA